MPGKVPPDELAAHVFDRRGAADDRVRQGPAFGEDAAAIDLPSPSGTLVVSSDPISLSATEAGRIGVHVACNDVAASGADPHWLTVVCLLPTDADDILETLTHDLDAAAREAGVSIVGGHTEYVDALERPVLSVTAMGLTDDFVPTGGARPGDRVVLASAAGLEGTAILAGDFGDQLDVDEATLERAVGYLDEIAVAPAASRLRGPATAMHDPTEGGILAGLAELATASDVRLEIDRNAIPVSAETETLCTAAGVDPLRIFGSGALLATLPEAAVSEAVDALGAAGIEAAEIGTVERADGDPVVALDGETIRPPVDDELYALWSAADATE